jgi:glucokinase
MKGRIKILVSQLDDRERDVLGASALAWEVPEYSLFK